MSVDLDSVAYQNNNRGGNIRQVLKGKTGCVTIPQIFIGGEFIGGCSELFDALKDGSLEGLLDRSGVGYDKGVDVDPYRFFAWVVASAVGVLVMGH